MSLDEDNTFYTVTMARVYADQGRNEEAARIYRYLLDRTPDRPDLQNKPVSSDRFHTYCCKPYVSNLLDQSG